MADKKQEGTVKSEILLSMMEDLEDEKKKAEESEEKFRSLVEITSDWIWEVDAKGVYTYASPKIKDILGYKPEEVIGKTPFDLMPKDEAKKVGKIFGEIIKNKKPFSRLENWNLHNNGKRILLETSGVPILDKKGNLIGYRGVDRDISERKKAEEKIRESEEKYRKLFETAKDAIFLSDETGKFIHVNQAACKSLGYSKNELLKLSNKQIDAEPIGFAMFKKVMAGIVKSVTFEVNQKRKDGTLFPVEVTGSFYKSGGEKIALAIARDITKQKKAEEKLKQEKEFSQTILETIPYGMDIVNENLRIMHMNKFFLNAFGKKSIGKKCFRVYKDNKKQCEKCPLKKPVKIGETKTLITSGVAGGKTFKITHTGFKLPDGKKVILEFFDDITKLKKD